MKTTVYIADLRHNYGGVLSTDCMPLAAGYLKAVMERDLGDEVDVEVFAYPAELFETMRRRPPDVMMSGNYVWNEALSLHALRVARRLNPDVLTVMGGPNIPYEPERQVEFVAARPEIDVYALGEADHLATDLVRRFLQAGRSVAELCEQDLPSSIRRRADGELLRNDQADRNLDVNDIPSPWLTGAMDKFFDGKMAPIIETNRGCPFKCAFCVQGTSFYSRITSFEMDRLHDEIEYIGRMVHERCPALGTLRIADANYGMYPRDEEISSYIGEIQLKYAYPTFIDATTGKNRADRIIRSMEKVNGALVLYQAVQSLDETVLRNIRRSNIRIEEYEKMQVHIRGRGMRSSSDLILGLPGESLQTHLAALHQLIDAGTHQVHCFQSMLLKGAELETKETRDQYDFTTRFRVLPKNWGEYEGERVFEIEEITVASDTLSFDDYLTCRTHHFNFSIYWNDQWFLDVARFCEERFGIEPSEWLTYVLEAVQANDGAMGALLGDFLDETRNELFDSREEAAAFYAEDENFERLRRGTIGDNLMYKYRAKASFFLWKEVCALGMEATRRLLLEKGAEETIPGFGAFWDEVTAYTEAKHADGQSLEEVLAPRHLTLHWDLQRWFDDGAPADIAPYRLGQPSPFVFRLTDEGASELTRAFATWTAELTGLTKLVTRIRVSSQVRNCTPETADAAVAG